jgi:hypothetical protein
MSNNTEALTKREKKLLSTAVVYGWEIEVWEGKKTGYWDADKIMPVKVGPIVRSLLEKGYLEHLDPLRYISFIRATEKAKALKCRNHGCSSGRIYNDAGKLTCNCPCCEFGILPEASND